MVVWDNKNVALLREFVDAGKSPEFVAAHFGISVSTLRMAMSRNGINIKHKENGRPSKLESNLKKIDLATRIRMLLGQELLNNRSDFAFSDDQIREWLEPNGFITFAKEVLNLELQGYQIEMIRSILNHKRVCIVAGRGVGKSFTIAVACVYIAITRSNQKILIISPAQRQSDLLYNKVLEFIVLSNELFNSVSRSNQEFCQFTNNSIIYPLPSTTFVRGFQGVNLIFCDESAFFLNPDQVWASIEPMLAIKNEKGEYGTLVLVGSPSGKIGKLWDCFNNPTYVRMQLPSTVNKYISQEWIELQKLQMPASVFQNEIMGQFSDTEDCFFPVDLIVNCTRDYDDSLFPESTKAYYLGIDVGRIKDSSVLTVLSSDRDGFLKVEEIKELSNKSFAIQKETIKLMHQNYRFRRICIEKAGLSLQMVEELKKMELPILEFIPTVDTKFEAYRHLLKQMEDAKLTISARHQKLQFELRNFRYEITEQGKVKLHHASELAGDDFVDSLCYAVWASKPMIRKGVFYIC